jgi:CHAD domain-containing protein
VASARFRRLTLDAAAWVEIGDWTRRDDELGRTLRQRPAAAAAAGELRRRSKRIRKEGARLGGLDARQRHKLRIRTKKLRYACEFFTGAFPGKKASRRREKFIAKLRQLQDALGDLNDIVVHEGLAQRVIARTNGTGKPGPRRGRGAKEAFAAGRLSGREEARFAPVMQIAEQAADGFARAAPFWSWA